MPKNRQNQGAADQGRIDWENMIAPAESPKGATFQTANGTAKAMGTGHNWQGPDFTWPEVPPHGPWKGGRNNRTGE